MRYAYPAEIEQDEAGFYLLTFPDVPEAATDSRNQEEALTEASGALAAALAGYVHARRPLPAPSRIENHHHIVPVPGLVAAKLALYEAMRERGMFSPAQLAEIIGKSPTAAARLMDPDHSSKWEGVEAALAALGHQVVIEAA